MLMTEGRVVMASGAGGVRATAVCPGMVDTDMIAHRNTPAGEFKIAPGSIAGSIVHLLRMPNDASAAELLINSRREAGF